MRRKTTRHIAKLPLGLAKKMRPGRLRRIVNESGAATKAYLARYSGSNRHAYGCDADLNADGRKERDGGKDISALTNNELAVYRGKNVGFVFLIFIVRFPLRNGCPMPSMKEKRV